MHAKGLIVLAGLIGAALLLHTCGKSGSYAKAETKTVSSHEDHDKTTDETVAVGSGRRVVKLSECWKFIQDDPSGAEAVAFDDSAWSTVRVPHDWAIAGPFNPQENGYAAKLPWRGVGWYRKVLDLDAADEGRRVYLDFDGVLAFPKVFVNGQLAGEWDYGYMSFRVDATKHVRFGERNIIAVRADTRRHGTRWYPGAGVYRKVTMTVCDPVHLAHWGTFISTPEVAESLATALVRSMIENHRSSQVEAEVGVTIIDPGGQTVALTSRRDSVPPGESREVSLSLQIARPRRWDIDDPKLYTARTTVRIEGQLVDTDVSTFGIRTFRFTADDGFHLNGRRVQLHGVNLHHDHGPLGAAFYPRAMERQLEIMKDMGCNSLRTSHNPPAPDVLDICDRMGIVVWNEAFDKYDEKADRPRDVPMADFGRRQIRNLVMRDRNHPSIVVWSIGNEIADLENNRGGNSRELIETLRAAVLEFDPTRPVGLGCYVPNAVRTRVLEPLDLTGWNYDRRYAPYRELFPHKPIIYSESASALSTRGFYELPLPDGKTDYSSQLQVDSYDLNAAPWSDIADAEFHLMEKDRFVAGELVWTGFDYLGEPTPFAREARSSYFGIVDLCGIPKDRFYLYRSYWRPETTTVHILPHWNWPDRVGKNVPVFVYTSGDSAELFLNGKTLGRRAKGEIPRRPVNFARGKTATASSEESVRGNVAAGATDGENTTRWCASSDGAGAWWQIDLGAVRPLRYLSIEFEREAKNYGYEVKASTGATAWKTIASKSTSRTPRWGGSREQSHEVKAEARYVRVEFIALAQRCWPSIREFGAFPGKVESEYYAPTYKYRLRFNDVIYEPGELKAVAYRGGQKIGEAVVRTAGPATALRVTPDRTRLSASGDDLSYVLVEAIDEKGTTCPLADHLVRFRIGGPAEVAGVGNGNPLSLEPFQANHRKLFFGKAMLILRAVKGSAGEISVMARAEGLQPGIATLEAKDESRVVER